MSAWVRIGSRRTDAWSVDPAGVPRCLIGRVGRGALSYRTSRTGRAVLSDESDGSDGSDSADWRCHYTYQGGERPEGEGEPGKESWAEPGSADRRYTPPGCTLRSHGSRGAAPMTRGSAGTYILDPLRVAEGAALRMYPSRAEPGSADQWCTPTGVHRSIGIGHPRSGDRCIAPHPSTTTPPERRTYRPAISATPWRGRGEGIRQLSRGRRGCAPPTPGL